MKWQARAWLIAGVLVAGPLTGGCASGCTGDPRTDNLGCAIANQGKYRRDTMEAQRRADAAAYDAQVAAHENRTARAELAALRGERLALQDRVAEASYDIALLEDRLQSRRAALSNAQYRLHEAELDRLRAEQMRLSRSSDTPQVRREIEQLEDDIARLRGMLN